MGDDIALDAIKWAQKMLGAQADVGKVAKNGTNQHFKYNYVQDVDVITAVRKAAIANGLVIQTSMPDYTERVETAGGRQKVYTTVKLTITVTDSETGYYEQYDWYGQGLDSDDKGIQKAATSGLKYALMKLFLIPSGDDDDPDSDAPVPPKPKTETPQTKQPVPDGAWVEALNLTKDQKAAFSARCKEHGVKWQRVVKLARQAGADTADKFVAFAEGIDYSAIKEDK